MAFNSDFPSMENTSPYGQIQFLQQLGNYQQFLSNDSSQNNIPEAKRQRLQDDIPKAKRRCLRLLRPSVEGFETSSSAAVRVTPPTPSPSCSSGSNDDGEDLEDKKGLFRQLNSEEPQVESLLKDVNIQPSSHSHGVAHPDVLYLCKPITIKNYAPMVMLPRSSLESIVGPHSMGKCYNETPPAPVKSSIVIDVSNKKPSFNILQNYQPATITVQDQSETENNTVMSIKISNVMSIAPAVFPSGQPEPRSGGDQLTITLSDGIDNNTSTTNGRHCSRPGKTNIQCHICNKKYVNSYKLKLHMHTHTGERPFVCGICNKGFTRRPNLISHQRIHSGAKPFSCTRGCGRDFRHPYDRLIHVVTEVCTRMNSMLKPLEGGGYQCTTCGRQLQEKGQAERHVRQHAAGVGLICSQCGINFQGLKAHILVKHMREFHPEYIKGLL